MNIEQIDIASIQIGARHRPVSPDAVSAIRASIEKIGLRTPLTVLDVDGGQTVRLVAGHHRLQALRELGMETAPCSVIEQNEVEAELWEISENLHRAELTALQRSEQIARWVELSEVSSQLATKPQGGRPEGGTRAAARELGVGKDEAHRSQKVASLTEEAKEAAREVGLDDNRSALLEAAKQSPSAQVTSIREYAERKASGVERDIKERAAKESAEIIAEYVPSDAWDMLKANLYAAGAKAVADALTNHVGNSITGAE